MDELKEKQKLSNVYVYKNNSMELIEELENVYIYNVSTCMNSINVMIHSDENKVDTIINLKNNGVEKAENVEDKQNDVSFFDGTSSYLNVLTNSTSKFAFMDSNLDMYMFSSIQEKKRKTDLGDEKEKEMDTYSFRVKNVAKCILEKKGYDKWQYKVENLEEKRKSRFLIKLKDLYFCSFEFYAVSKNKDIYKWNVSIDEKKIIPNYHSQFPKYIPYFEKEKISKISCGMYHTLFLTEKGNCYISGNNDSYQLGINKTSHVSTPLLVNLNCAEACRNTNQKEDQQTGGKKVKLISAGHSHNIVVTTDNEMYGWGFNIKKQLLLNTPFIKTPTMILNKQMWKMILQKKKKKKKKQRNITHIKKGNSSNNMHIVEKFDREVYKLHDMEKNWKHIRNLKNKEQFEIQKVCCGFSFSCFLLKNKKCYIFGTENEKEKKKQKITKTSINIPKKINGCNQIDDIHCNFFHIILIMHLKILKVEPSLIHPNLGNSIFISLNFPIRNPSNFNVDLCKSYPFRKAKQKQFPKENTLTTASNDVTNTTNVLFHLNYFNAKKKYTFDGLKFSQNYSAIESSRFWEKPTDQLFSLNLLDKRNKQVYVKIYNPCVEITHSEKILISTYQGKIKNVIPNNFDIQENIRLKILIKKVPIHINKNDIYVLYVFLSKGKKVKYIITKGILNKKRNSIFTKLSFYNDKVHHFNDTYTNEITTLKQCDTCNIFFSFNNFFFSNSFSLYIINPHIEYIQPDHININENKKVLIKMANLENKHGTFEVIHILLYNSYFKAMYMPAHYDYDDKNYSFFIPLIPKLAFTQLQSDFIKFQIFASYNKIQYNINEVFLTISNV